MGVLCSQRLTCKWIWYVVHSPSWIASATTSVTRFRCILGHPSILTANSTDVTRDTGLPSGPELISPLYYPASNLPYLSSTHKHGIMFCKQTTLRWLGLISSYGTNSSISEWQVFSYQRGLNDTAVLKTRQNHCPSAGRVTFITCPPCQKVARPHTDFTLRSSQFMKTYPSCRTGWVSYLPAHIIFYPVSGGRTGSIFNTVIR